MLQGCKWRSLGSAAGAPRPCGVARPRGRAHAAARWTAGSDDAAGPLVGAGSAAHTEPCSSSSSSSSIGQRFDTLDADWAAFPKPGFGRFHQPLAATAPAAPVHGGGLQTELWEHACNPLLQAHEVYVILFGAEGNCELEGIYSLRSPGPEGLPCETIIAFESLVDAQRYCGLVEAAMDSAHAPTVCALMPHDLAAFCTDHAYQCRLEVAGSLLMPPHRSVALTDWERALRLRRGIFEVLPEEPVLAQQQQADQQQHHLAQQPCMQQPHITQQQQGLVQQQQCMQPPPQQPSWPAEGHVLPHAAGEVARSDQLAAVAAALEALLKRPGPPDSAGGSAGSGEAGQAGGGVDC